jgi:hypothetical protein
LKDIVFTPRVYDLPYATDRRRGVHPQLDLRTHPHTIDEIPELRIEPLLKCLVLALNDPSGIFMTLGSDLKTSRPGRPGSTVIPVPAAGEGAPYWYTANVIFSFWCLTQNTQEHFRDVYDRCPSGGQDCIVCFEWGPAYYWALSERAAGKKSGNASGAVCGIWVTGWGGTASEAHDKWSDGMNGLISFFRDASSTLKGLESPSGLTLSEIMFG